jgi:hypothetical protein
LAIIIASARATSFSVDQHMKRRRDGGKDGHTWEMNVHFVTIEIGIVRITAQSAKNLD